MKVEEFLSCIVKTIEEIQELYRSDAVPWVVGYSGGKDSTATLQLVWQAIAQLPPQQRHKTVWVITTDTLVENPVVSAWVKRSHDRIRERAIAEEMPVEPRMLLPEMKHRFWVNLIGHGYPSPRPRFRWCTERLKIRPTNQFIRSLKEAIVVLGVRRKESSNRARSMQSYCRDRLNPHPELPNSRIYAPIDDWLTDEVWFYLNQYPNPWGHSNKELFSMYRGATADNDCPLVVDKTTPSCGNSRFGCWVCTLVSQDKSMEAMIQNDEEKEWMEPLLDIRNELDVQDDRDRREFRRKRGDITLFERGDEVVNVPGPYKREWREYFLRRVLSAQVEISRTIAQHFELLPLDELSEIRRIWIREKYEFDDSLPRIYEEEIGRPFVDPVNRDQQLLDRDAWEALEEVADDPHQLELISHLLGVEDAHRPKRHGVYGDLKQCFEKRSRSKEEAISNAHLARDMKAAAENGDTESIRQLSWADLKFDKG